MVLGGDCMVIVGIILLGNIIKIGFVGIVEFLFFVFFILKI